MAELAIEVVEGSDVGRVRQANEDSFLVNVDKPDAETVRQRGILLLVADGMGGAAGGAHASSLVVKTVFESYYGDAWPGEPRPLLNRAITAANEVVYQTAAQHPELHGMGSTCTAAVVLDAKLYAAHVGDTRLYLVRNHTIEQITQDHSTVAEMVRHGLITPEEAENHPRRNVISRSVGPRPQVQVDVLGPLPLREGDVLVLCTDGLTTHVEDREILSIVDTRRLAAARDELIALANDRGGRDNITVILAQVGQRALAAPAPFPSPGGPAGRPGPEGTGAPANSSAPEPPRNSERTPTPAHSLANPAASQAGVAQGRWQRMQATATRHPWALAAVGVVFGLIAGYALGRHRASSVRRVQPAERPAPPGTADAPSADALTPDTRGADSAPAESRERGAAAGAGHAAGATPGTPVTGEATKEGTAPATAGHGNQGKHGKGSPQTRTERRKRKGIQRGNQRAGRAKRPSGAHPQRKIGQRNSATPPQPASDRTGKKNGKPHVDPALEKGAKQDDATSRRPGRREPSSPASQRGGGSATQGAAARGGVQSNSGTGAPRGSPGGGKPPSAPPAHKSPGAK